MTVALSNRIVLAENVTAGTDRIDVGFPVLDPSNELTVLRLRGDVVTTLEPATHWTWAAASGGVGGEVLLEDVALAGDSFAVMGTWPVARVSDFTSSSIFSSLDVNQQHDRIWKTLQELARDVGSSLKSDAFGQAFDAGGLPIVNAGTDTSGTSVATITHHDVLRLTRTTPDGLDAPLWKVTARGNKNHAKSKQLAGGAIAGAHQDFLSSSTDSDSSVLTKHPAAGELSIEIGNDPGSTAAAHFALHGTDRDVFRVVLDFDLRWIDLDLGDVVTLSHARLGLSAGRKLLVIAIDLDFNARRVALDLWG